MADVGGNTNIGCYPSRFHDIPKYLFAAWRKDAGDNTSIGGEFKKSAPSTKSKSSLVKIGVIKN